jgi:hypothetical protein
LRRKLYIGFSDQQYTIRKKTHIAEVFFTKIISKNKSRAKCSAFVLTRIIYKH